MTTDDAPTRAADQYRAITTPPGPTRPTPPTLHALSPRPAARSRLGWARGRVVRDVAVLLVLVASAAWAWHDTGVRACTPADVGRLAIGDVPTHYQVTSWSGTVVGAVRTAAGEPVAGVPVRLGAGPTIEARTSSAGWFVLHAPPGRTTLVVARPDAPAVTLPIALHAGVAQPVRVTLRPASCGAPGAVLEAPAVR